MQSHLYNEAWVGAPIDTLDTPFLDDIYRYRNGNILIPKRNQSDDYIRICLEPTDEYREIACYYCGSGHKED